jgi:hypothetical protein
MSDEWKAVVAVGQSFTAHETVQHAWQTLSKWVEMA